MKLKVCFVVICLCFVATKAEDYIINAFRSLIEKQPVNMSLIPEPAFPVDVHILSRLLKKVATGPCLMLTENVLDQTLLNGLFPKVQVHSVSPDVPVDLLISKILNFTNTHGGYVTVLTDLPSRTNDIQTVHQQIPHLCYISVDGLLNKDKAHIHVDMPKLLKLMKRNIRVVCTAAIIPRRYEQRKNQYIRSIQTLEGHGYSPYVVESCVAGPTFLDEYCNNVCYTLSNNAYLKNKGVNESVSLLMALQKWNFNDDDIILKLTGRYVLQFDKLLRLLEEADDVAAVAKFEQMDRSSVLTGCFAMRYDLMKQMYASYDYEKLEKEMICIEHEVGPYLEQLEKEGFKLIRLGLLGIEANVFGGGGSDKLTYW